MKINTLKTTSYKTILFIIISIIFIYFTPLQALAEIKGVAGVKINRCVLSYVKKTGAEKVTVDSCMEYIENNRKLCVTGTVTEEDVTSLCNNTVKKYSKQGLIIYDNADSNNLKDNQDNGVIIKYHNGEY